MQTQVLLVAPCHSDQVWTYGRLERRGWPMGELVPFVVVNMKRCATSSSSVDIPFAFEIR
jgi:hypothetical protein